MRFGTLMLVVGAVVLVAGCSVTTDPYTPLSVSGSITAGGEPAIARVELAAGNFRTVRDYEGSYLISVSGGGVPASSCGDVSISAALLDTDGTVLDEETRDLNDCGEHVVDFEFP